MPFSTYDKDNDNFSKSCSKEYGGNGGWWFNSCDRANLNGHNYADGIVTSSNKYDGILWYYMTNQAKSLKAVTMSIYPKNL